MTNTTAAQPLDLDALDKLEALARAATPQDFDSAQIKRTGGWAECPACDGEGTVSLGNDFCNYDMAPQGVQFYGIGDAHVNTEAYYRAVTPATVLKLIAQARAAQPESAALSGFKLVPVEPTHAMIGAGARAQLNADAGQQANSLTMAKAAYAAMISAAPAISTQTGWAVDEAARLRKVLIDVRQALQFANDSPGGGINDTIWMMHTPEMLFDFIDAALAQPESATGTTGAIELLPEDLLDELNDAVIEAFNGAFAIKDWSARDHWRDVLNRFEDWRAQSRAAPASAQPADDRQHMTHDEMLALCAENPAASGLPLSAQPDRGAAQEFDQAKFMQMVREFAEVCYGLRRTTEDVGKNLIDYVKSLAAPSPASQPVAQPRLPKLPKTGEEFPGYQQFNGFDMREYGAACVRAAVAPSDAKGEAETALPKVFGVSRDAESPGGKGVLVTFHHALTDNELRSFHDSLTTKGKADAANADGLRTVDEEVERTSAMDRAFPITDNPHTSVQQRTMQNRVAFGLGWDARAALSKQDWQQGYADALDLHELRGDQAPAQEPGEQKGNA
jgi:hypothetical protein